MLELYELVKVADSEDYIPLIGEQGIISKIHIDIDNNKLYELIFIGKSNNDISHRFGGALFYEHELEGI